MTAIRECNLVMNARASVSLGVVQLITLYGTLLLRPVSGHGRMVHPTPRQPEPMYWYQVGCMIGCECSGGGKENYPSLQSVNCNQPAQPTNTQLTWNIGDKSPQGPWNKFMPWRAPGKAKPIDSCGIASGFLPTAGVQHPHKFQNTNVAQGMRGTELPKGDVTVWDAGAVVEASYTLRVNHGGGYQYRVCPSDNGVVNEACFEANVLRFADSTSVVRYLGENGSMVGQEIRISATDVNEGVFPTGSAWRRLPMPACNCDLGADCRSGSGDDFRSAYSDTRASGSCDTGVQFEAPHLTDGSWPEGYGYFLGDLKPGNIGSSRGYEKAGTKGDYAINWIAGFGDPEARTMSAKAGQSLVFEWAGNGHNVYKLVDANSLSSCDFTDAVQQGTGNTGPVLFQIPEDAAVGSQFFFACQVGTHCQGGQHLTVTITDQDLSMGKSKDMSSTDKDKMESTHKDKMESTSEDLCSAHSDETTCVAESGCEWYDFKGGVCWNPSAKMTSKDKGGSKPDFSGEGTEDSAATWVVVDKLVAPSEPGNYLLQWRWDNEQTPQIWTTCADITVQPSATSSSRTMILLPAASLFGGLLCALLDLL